MSTAKELMVAMFKDKVANGQGHNINNGWMEVLEKGWNRKATKNLTPCRALDYTHLGVTARYKLKAKLLAKQKKNAEL